MMKLLTYRVQVEQYLRADATVADDLELSKL